MRSDDYGVYCYERQGLRGVSTPLVDQLLLESYTLLRQNNLFRCHLALSEFRDLISYLGLELMAADSALRRAPYVTHERQQK